MLSPLKNYSILYVEDEPEIQANIAEYLNNYFKTVFLASDGKEALRIYQGNRPEVILLDINLPKMDGLDVAQEIRRQDQSTKIIMLTAFTEKEKLLKATELRLTRYLVKPVTPKDFKETLELLVEELKKDPSRYLQFGNIYIWDKELQQLYKDEQQIMLKEKQYHLLVLLLKNKGKSVSYNRIMSTLWEDYYEAEISIDSVKNQVSQLRKIIPHANISSVYGVGYMLA